MIQRARKIIKRYALVALLFVCLAIAGLLVYGQRPEAGDNAAAPSQVIVAQATVVDQGIQIEWLQSQVGAHPLAGYIVERSRNGGNFEQIVRVEPVFLSYLDAEGEVGDTYRITVEDAQSNRSPASEPVAASAAKPGSTAAVETDGSRVLGANSKLESLKTPSEQAKVLEGLIAQAFEEFDAASLSGDTALSKRLLSALQQYQMKVLSLWPQLAPDQKAMLAQNCASQLDTFETNLLTLPEHTRMNGMLVLAGCQAVEDA